MGIGKAGDSCCRRSDAFENHVELLSQRETAVSGWEPAKRQKMGDKVTVRITMDTECDLDFVQVYDKPSACLEPTSQLSGYDYTLRYYCATCWR